jgi:phospholipid-binding lipoprotein MlaA
MRRSLTASLVLASAVLLSACASTGPGQQTGEVYDPLEPANRKIFSFNDAVDEAVIEPAAVAYRDTLPSSIRTGISNVLKNLRSPIIFGNQVLQGDIEGAGNVLVRFVVNTLAGLGGLMDPAAENGYPFQDEDFGQTLAVWGVGDGPYLVVPLLGPSNTRDLVGFVVDIVADPIGILADNQHVAAEVAISRGSSTALDQRSKAIDGINDIKRTSIDYYASIRSFYKQNRDGAILDGQISPDIPDFQTISDADAEPDEDMQPSILGAARLAEKVE